MFNYRREIDGLRALAVVPVILFHADFETFSGGFVGVDIFFVISGYLITSIILTQKSLGTFSLLSFYERRARRILPSLFLVMVFCILFSWLWLMPSYMKDFSKSLVASSVFLSNILFWQQSGYFDLAEELKPLLHTWSLSVEGQYYVFFPVFFLLMWRFTKLSTVATIFFITVLSFGLAQWGAYNKPEAAFFLLPTRAWEFAIGILVAFYLARYPKTHLLRQMREIGSLIGIILIFYSVFTYSKETPFPSVYALAPTLGTAFLILYATPSTFLGRVLSTKIFVGVGLISYSSYLWHYPLFVFARIIFGQIEFIGFILLFILTFIIAFYTYKYVELPFRKNKLNFFKNFSLILLSFLLIFFILFGLYGYFSNGIERRLNPSEFNFSQTLKRSTEINCSLPIRDCVTKASNAPSVLLLGDSNAYHFSTSLKEVSETNGLNYYQLTMGGCLPLANYFRLDQNYKFNKRCINFNSKIREALSENRIKIDVIVVSAAWLVYLEGSELENYFEKDKISTSEIKNISSAKLSTDGFTVLSQLERKESFDRYLNEMLSFLAAKSKKLIVSGPIPPSLANFSNIKSFFYMKGVNVNDFKLSSLNFNKMIQNRELNFSYIDISKVLCTQKTCLVRDQHGSFYNDGMHFSEYGQRIIFKPLIERSISNK